MPKRLRLRYATLTGLDAYLPRFKSPPEDSVFGRAWHGIHREFAEDGAREGFADAIAGNTELLTRT